MLHVVSLPAALAAPTMFSAPPPTLGKGAVAGGGAVGYTSFLGGIPTTVSGTLGTVTIDTVGGPAIGGWGRTGTGRRVEAYGGAFLPFQPVQLGVYGGFRGSVGNPGGADGLGASAGLEVADDLLRAGTTLAISAPLQVGWQTRGAHLWLTVAPEVYSSATFEVAGRVGFDVPIDVYTIGLLAGYSYRRAPLAAFTFSYGI